MSKILNFKGTWRTYQSRVLSRADQYLKDGKIHIVAAPGSGKTTLGIELIGRIDRPSVIFAPSITIREQWIERIKEGFLVDGINPTDVISNNLKEPKFITVATYQALHSAITRFCGKLTEESEELEMDAEDTLITMKEEDVDYSDFELVQSMQSVGLGIICLDECHHLRSEWWKALEEFCKAFSKANVISLTATPPYDSTTAMWKRYIDMCGEIDEEITIPELVKEGTLCPHQDYVLFNYPTREEKKEIDNFKQNSEEMLQILMNDSSLLEVIKTHKCLNGEVQDEVLLDKPAYLSAILIYLNEKQVAFPKRLQSLLLAKELPHMEEKWMEQILQGLLYDDFDSYMCDKVYQESLIRELKKRGLLEKKKVCMIVNSQIQKMLIQSKGKIESIKQIVAHEYANMGDQLRLLILTDYIRKECEANLGDSNVEMNQLGVIPFFEILRKEAEKNHGKQFKLRFGVLCGTMVIIPSEAKNHLLSIVGPDRITFSKAGKLSEEDYLVVRAIGNAHFLTAAITELFTAGEFQVLIGTKSLLGEGWDAPCINSLILASFVGSFMLSNQMRGRAIRIDKNNPDKVSNIWHLVCINPSKSGTNNEKDTGEDSEDFQMLCRRMEHFLGLHYEEDTIENGVARLSAIKRPILRINVGNTNDQMLTLSKQRDQLRTRWKNAIEIINKMEVTEQVDVSDQFITLAVFYDALRRALVTTALSVFGILTYVGIPFGTYGIFGKLVIAGLILLSIYFIVKACMFHSPLKQLKSIGKGIQKAMIQTGVLSNPNNKVVTEPFKIVYKCIYLLGGSGKEKKDFSSCVLQFFSEIDNQRYLLVRHRRRKRLDGFYVVPEVFAKNKEDAQVFLSCMKPYIGNYDLVYTRNAEGRKLLLEGRVTAFSNREQRCVKKKKVKGALE